MVLSDFYKQIAKNIRKFRKAKGLTQEELAEKSGLSQDYIQKIESLKNNPGLIGLVAIINALEVSFKTFFESFE